MNDGIIIGFEFSTDAKIYLDLDLLESYQGIFAFPCAFILMLDGSVFLALLLRVDGRVLLPTMSSYLPTPFLGGELRELGPTLL